MVCPLQSERISASKVEKTISQLRKTARMVENLNGKKTVIEKDLGLLSQKTQGYYLKAVKQFYRWMVQDQRSEQSPVEHLQAKKSTSKKRQALEPKQVSMLKSTNAAETIYNMGGHERALMYRLAIETGLRASEIKSLKTNNFDFHNNTVTVEAAYTKNRSEAVLPLRQNTARLLKDFMKTKMPNAQAFNLPHSSNYAKMLRKDLSRIDLTEQQAMKLDFHSLRHTFGTMLAASGVHPKVAQDLMRHSDINLTMTRYTHTLRGQQTEAIESMPVFLPVSKQKQRATGTEDISANSSVAPAYKKLAKNADLSSFQMSAIGNKKTKDTANCGFHKPLYMAALSKEKDQMLLSGLDYAREDSNLQPSDSKSATLSN